MRPRRPVVLDRGYSLAEAAQRDLHTARGIAKRYGVAVASVRTWTTHHAFPQPVGYIDPPPYSQIAPRLWAAADVDAWYAHRWPRKAAALQAAYARGVRDGKAAR